MWKNDKVVVVVVVHIGRLACSCFQLVIYKFVSEAPGELGWVLTMIIVSLISAVVGAIVMIVVLHCKR